MSQFGNICLEKEKNKINLKDIIRGQIDENIVRKNFTLSEAVAIWQAMESYQKTGKKRPPSEFDEPRQKASKLVGLSTDSLSKAKQIVDSGKKSLEDSFEKEDL